MGDEVAPVSHSVKTMQVWLLSTSRESSRNLENTKWSSGQDRSGPGIMDQIDSNRFDVAWNHMIKDNKGKKDGQIRHGTYNWNDLNPRNDFDIPTDSNIKKWPHRRGGPSFWLCGSWRQPNLRRGSPKVGHPISSVKTPLDITRL